MIFRIDRLVALYKAGRISPRLLWNYLIGRRKVLILEATSRCNLNCAFCFIYQCKGPKGHMTPETFAKAAQIFPKMGVVSLSGWGESFLHPDIISLIRQVKAAGCDANITTNGTLLTPALSEAVIDSKLDGLQLSFDGAQPATYEELRRGAKFEQVVANFRTLAELKKKKGSRTPCLMMQFVTTMSNYKEIPDVVDLAATMGISFLTFKTVDHIAKESDLALTLLPQAGRPVPIAEIKEALREAEVRAKKHGLFISTIGKMNMLEDQELKISPNSCDPASTIFVSYLGDVSPCCPLGYTMPRYFQGKICEEERVTFGNLNQETFEEIWAKPEYQKFRDDFRNGPPPKSCKTCYLLYGW